MKKENLILAALYVLVIGVLNYSEMGGVFGKVEVLVSLCIVMLALFLPMEYQTGEIPTSIFVILVLILINVSWIELRSFIPEIEGFMKVFLKYLGLLLIVELVRRFAIVVKNNPFRYLATLIFTGLMMLVAYDYVLLDKILIFLEIDNMVFTNINRILVVFVVIALAFDFIFINWIAKIVMLSLIISLYVGSFMINIIDDKNQWMLNLTFMFLLIIIYFMIGLFKRIRLLNS